VPEICNEEQLLSALKESLRARRTVPPEFVETGKNAYAWHSIDADLAQLTYDSISDLGMATSMRSEPASIRALTFTSKYLTIELEVSEDSLLGQVIPTRPGTLEIHSHAGTIATTPVDEVGSFRVHPIPGGPFRLNCHIPDGANVLTGWITL
jgi:hypothetical protein